MAKSSLTIEIDQDTAFQIGIAARTVGDTTEAFAARIFAEAVRAAYWAPAEASIAEYERTGVSYSVEEVFSAMRARLGEKQTQGG